MSQLNASGGYRHRHLGAHDFGGNLRSWGGNGMKAAIIALIATALACSSLYAASAQGDDFAIAPGNVSTFRYGDYTFLVYASLRNDTSSTAPRTWQFRYDPLFMPQTAPDGTLAFSITPEGPGVRLV